MTKRLEVPKMDLDQAEALLWAAFPKADSVIAKSFDCGFQMGLGVQFGEYRNAIKFNPKRDKIALVIKQLRQRILADQAA